LLLRWRIRFLDDGWVARAEALGWGPFDLFGCNRPFARTDHAGLLWFLKGGKLLALTAETAKIETVTGCPQSFSRRPVDVGSVVLVWELVR
jgi:hypothetical protein